MDEIGVNTVQKPRKILALRRQKQIGAIEQELRLLNLQQFDLEVNLTLSRLLDLPILKSKMISFHLKYDLTRKLHHKNDLTALNQTESAVCSHRHAREG